MKHQLSNNLNLFGTLVFSVIALVNQEISVFYMLYLFWWQELISIFGSVFSKIKKGFPFFKSLQSLGQSLFLMGIYFVFIVVMFGFVFSFRNEKLFSIFAEVLMFMNVSFNLNLLVALVLMLVKVFQDQIVYEDHEIFSANMIVLHISIILGAGLHFLIKEYFADSFDNKSIIPYIVSAVPFLFLKTVFEYYKNKENKGNTPTNFSHN